MEQLIQALAPYITYRSVKKGSMLLYQSEIPREAYIVRKGFVRAFTIVSSGDERTIALYTKGDIFPIPWLYGETRNTLFYYEAGSDVELACVSKKDFMAVVTPSSELTAVIFNLLIKSNTALLMRVTALEQSNAADKIVLILYYLLIRHGAERKPGQYTIDIKMTQSMIASLVGLTRESTAIHIAELKKLGVISYSNFIYVVNKSKLEKLIGIAAGSADGLEHRK